jgi:transcriptional regulator with XRE-family HTH domain
MTGKEEILIKIGFRIRAIREEKNISQQDLAAACNFEKSNMSRIESGRTNLTIGTLLKISEALDVKLIDLIHIE